MDSSVAEATRANTDIGNRMADLAEDQYKSGQELVDRYAPIYDKILQGQLDSSTAAEGRANEQWDNYRNTFQPIERKVADEAMNYDGAAETARRTGLAAGTVQKQSDAAYEMNARRMASMGISPTSGRTQQSMTDQANTTALAKAGAINSERNNTKMTGMSLRQGAANLGRGISGTSLAQAGMGIGAGQAAAGTMGASTGQRSGALAPANSLYGGATSAYDSAGGMGIDRFKEQAKSNQYGSEGMGEIVGVLGSVAGAYFSSGAWAASSSKKGKKDVAPVDDGAAMEAMRKVPSKEWTYKPGVGDGGRHVGPMAEDMQAAAGDGVAPGGKQIDMISMMGMQHAATRDVDVRLQAVEQKVGVKGGKAKTAAEAPAPRQRNAFPMAMESLPL